MPVDVDDRPRRRLHAAPVCAADGMPLYPTIVGPRCPICGATGQRPLERPLERR